MRSHSEVRTLSTKRYRLASVQFLSLIVLFAVCGTGTRAALLAQGKTKLQMKPRVSLGVVIDVSAHQKKVIEFEREVVNSLADAFAGLATESFVVRYADEVEILQGWSPLDTGLMTVSRRIELDAHSAKNGRTFLYDAVNVGLLEFDTGNSANSKVLIIIGEGNDAGSLARYSQIKKRAKSATVQCFVLLVADHNLMGGRVRHFGFDLYDLASATKGKAFDVGDSRKNLDKAIKGVLKRIGQ